MTFISSILRKLRLSKKSKNAPSIEPTPSIWNHNLPSTSSEGVKEEKESRGERRRTLRRQNRCLGLQNELLAVENERLWIEKHHLRVERQVMAAKKNEMARKLRKQKAITDYYRRRLAAIDKCKKYVIDQQ